MTGEASVAEGRETPISCPSCGGHVHVIFTTADRNVVHVLPCEHDVSRRELLGKPPKVAA